MTRILKTARTLTTLAGFLTVGLTTGFGDGSNDTLRVCPGAKLIFVLYCRSDLTHQECMARWDDKQHAGLVKKIPHLIKHTHNETTQLPFVGATDGIGELWFPNTGTMNTAIASPEFAAAVADAQRFLDLSKTYAIVVNEISVIGNGCGIGDREDR